MSAPGERGHHVVGLGAASQAHGERSGRHASNVLQVRSDLQGSEPVQAPVFIAFVAMPFMPSYDDVFFVGIRAAVRALHGEAVRVDQMMHGGDAVNETLRQIRRCDLLIADLSSGETDVLYELGYAHALKKPVVQLCSTPYEDLPFMVRNRETVPYTFGRTHLLVSELAVYIARLLGLRNDYEVEV